MSNPIDNGPRPPVPGNTPLGKGPKADGDPAAGSRAERAGGAEGGDATAESDRLQSVRQRIDQTPEVDRERVEAIKAQIANGEYPVDAEKVARKFAQLEAMIHDD